MVLLRYPQPMDDTLFNTLFVADESVERDDASLQERGSSENEDGAEHCDEGSHTRCIASSQQLSIRFS